MAIFIIIEIMISAVHMIARAMLPSEKIRKNVRLGDIF